jgi:hypothetical protein
LFKIKKSRDDPVGNLSADFSKSPHEVHCNLFWKRASQKRVFGIFEEHAADELQKNSENSLTRIFFRAILLNNYKKQYFF